MGLLSRIEGKEARTARGRSLVIVLTAVVALLVLALIGGSIYGLATGSRAKMLARGGASLPSGTKVFSGLGTIRASSRDKVAAVILATPSFPYPAGDRAFADELDSKKDALREAVRKYLASRTAEELSPAFEAATKAGIREAINGVLDLGEADTIWLSDFSVVQ